VLGYGLRPNPTYGLFDNDRAANIAEESITMDKVQFRQLFLRSVHQALESAQKGIGTQLSNDFEIELHGGGIPGEIVSQNHAVDIMYLGANKFYRIVDVGVKYIDSNNRARVFVRIGDHPPSNFDDTWNNPAGNGPFKVIEPLGDIRRKPQ
jgi:hypothetical protein